MPIPTNPKLYEQVKKYADTIYEKPSAYKSGFIVKKYKELGGEYIDDCGVSPHTPDRKRNCPKNLKRWFKEDWKDIGGLNYPVYRPTKRISKMTPLTPVEIDPVNLQNQILLKQRYKGRKNLPAFIYK